MTHAPLFRRLRHAMLVLIGFVLLFTWLFAQPLFTGRLLAESDLFDQYLPLFLSPALVWSSFEFGGVPAFADPENSAFYPVRWFFAHVAHSWNGFIISAFVLGGCFTYGYLFFHTRSRAAAAFGSVGFVLSEAMLERVPHPNILHAIVWVPLLLLALDAMRVSRSWMLWMACASFAGAACVLAGHPQVALYAAYLSAAYAVCGLIAERARAAQWLRVAGAALLALMVCAVVAVPLLELSAHSVRQTLGYTEFVDYANTPWQMLSALYPGITHPGLEAPTYVGLLVLLCAGIALSRLRSDWRIGFWVAVAVLGLMLGAGDATPLARVVFGLPIYDRFRIVSRNLIFAAFAFNVLAAYGLAALLSGGITRRAMALVTGVFIAGMLGAATLLAAWPAAVQFDVVDESFPLPWVVDAVWKQLLLLGVVLAALMFVWRQPRSRLAPVLLVAVLTIDLAGSSTYKWSPSGLAMVTVDPQEVRPGVHARTLAAQLAPSRQRFLAVPDTLRDGIVPGVFARPWGIANAGGYTSLLLRDVSALALMSANGHVQDPVLMAKDLALDLLAVRFLVVREPIAPTLDAATTGDDARWRRGERFSIVDGPRSVEGDERGPAEYVVLENQKSMPRAWIASQVLPATDGVIADAIRTSEIRRVGPFDPRTTALVFEGDLHPARYASGGTAEVSSIEDSRIKVTVSSPGGGYLVLSEAYYPGWRARIDDGEAQPVHKTDLALQGVTLPPGSHVVTFEFVSAARRAGLLISAAGALILVGMMLLAVRDARIDLE